MPRLLLAIILVGCGSKGDVCQRLMDKMAPVVKQMGEGKDWDQEKAKALAECRKNIDKVKDDALTKCVLDASGDEAVKACMQKPFDDYKSKSKTTEAALQLNKIGKSAKRAFAEAGAFPKGSAKILPSAGCCGSKDNKCAVTTEWIKDPVWSALEFEIDEPNMYQYSYASADGTSFKATAVGDTDCDGAAATFTLEGKSDGGNPRVTLTEPPKGVY